MTIIGNNTIRFSGLEYTLKLTVNIESTVFVSPGVYATENDIRWVDSSFPVENTILDQLSMEIDMDIDADMIKKLILMAKDYEDRDES